MNNSQTINRIYENVGWGLLAVLWGATILFDFLPFGAGLVGTGLILLGVNIVRAINHLPTRNDNNFLGLLVLAWGGLELARSFLRQMFPSADLDWVIFAILLIGFGMLLLARVILRASKSINGPFADMRKES